MFMELMNVEIMETFNLYLDEEDHDAEDGQGKKTIIKKNCASCGAECPIAKKKCHCGEEFAVKGPRPKRKLTSSNPTRLKEYIKKYAEALKENCGTNVIVIYSASHTRLAKSGHQSIVHDVTTFATDGAAANFMGEGAIDTRPETGKKILNLMKAFMKASESKVNNPGNGNSPGTTEIVELPKTNCSDQSEKKSRSLDGDIMQNLLKAESSSSDSSETAFLGIPAPSGTADSLEKGSSTESFVIASSTTEIVELPKSNCSDQSGKKSRSLVKNIKRKRKCSNSKEAFLGMSAPPFASSSQEKDSSTENFVIASSSASQELKSKEVCSLEDESRSSTSEFATNIDGPIDNSIIKTISNTGKKLTLDEINWTWETMKGRRVQILWPTLTPNKDEDDLWGNKYWEATFTNETLHCVDICYNGFFSDLDGNRSFNELGKCTTTTSKSNLIRNWTIRILRH